MSLWNFEHTKHSNDLESVECWRFLLNRLDIILRRRMFLNFFMIVCSIAILAIIAFLSSSMNSVYKEITYAFSICIGIVLCFIWRIFGLYYSEMIYVRSNAVYEFEKNFSIQLYSYESEEMGKRKRTAPMAINFIENIVPLIILVLYLLLLLMHFINVNFINTLKDTISFL